MVGKYFVIEPQVWIEMLKYKEGRAWEKNIAESLHGQATWTDKWLYKGPLLNFTLLQCQKKPWDLEINVKAAFIVLCSVLKRKVTHFLLYFPVSRRGLNWVKWS